MFEFFHKLWRKLFPPLVIFVPTRLDVRPGDRDMVPQLAHHNGFLWLMGKLSKQRAILSAELENYQHSREEDLWLKAGIHWLKFLERSLQLEIANATSKSQSESDDEVLKQILSAMKGVGETAPQG